MSPQYLENIPEWILSVTFLIALLIMRYSGYQLGRRLASAGNVEIDATISTIMNSLLGILALLLAFTVSMSVSRFEARTFLVQQEANSISRSYFRAALLPQPERSELAGLLCSYATARLQFSQRNQSLKQLRPARNDLKRLQNAIWAVGVGYAQKEPVRANLLLQTLNETIDLEMSRWMSFDNHVPATVIYLDAIVGLLAAHIIGFVAGLTKKQHLFANAILALAITLVLTVIIDLDRPSQGFVRVSRQPLVDLVNELPDCPNLASTTLSR